jgi:Lar family restriction alleviation protein
MGEEMKPCPFCGGEAYYARLSKTHGGIKCRRCNSGGDLFESKAGAVAAWNRRAPSSQSPSVGEEMKLEPCPFCGGDLKVRRGVNPWAHCETEGCWAQRSQVVALDDPRQVAAWNRRAPSSQSPSVGDGWKPTHRHKSTGGEYQLLGHGAIQTTMPLEDHDEVAIYRGRDGRLWARAKMEFQDGRFERIAPPPPSEGEEGAA